MPPALLIRSTPATTARCMSGPYEPPAPVSGHSVPMAIGSFDCADKSAGAPSTSPAVVDIFKTSRRVSFFFSVSPSATEIDTANLRVVAQGGPRPFSAHPAHRQNIRPLTQGERLARV